MARASQVLAGVQSACALPKVADRESRSWPVTSLTVNPFRSLRPTDRPTASRPPRGPEADPRTVRAPSLPTGASRLPVQPDNEGRALATLTTPARVFRPNSA